MNIFTSKRKLLAKIKEQEKLLHQGGKRLESYLVENDHLFKLNCDSARKIRELESELTKRTITVNIINPKPVFKVITDQLLEKPKKT